MGCKCWIAGLTLCVGVTGWEPAAAQTPAGFAVQVFLQDDGRVPADVLEQAKHAATSVFALSNIDLQWIGQGPYQPCSLTVRIVAKPTGARNRSRFVVGLAPETREARGILAFAFYDRIQLYSAELGLDASQMLGHVMAHELGHLLLPHGAHSDHRRDARGVGWRASEPGNDGAFDFHTGRGGADTRASVRLRVAHCT